MLLFPSLFFRVALKFFLLLCYYVSVIVVSFLVTLLSLSLPLLEFVLLFLLLFPWVPFLVIFVPSLLFLLLFLFALGPVLVVT